MSWAIRQNLKAHLALFAANFIYGANYTIAKDVLQHFIQPFGFILLRVSGAVVLFGLIWFFQGQQKIEKKDRFRLLICALTGVAINQLLFFKGLSLTSPIHAAIMLTINPIAVLVLLSFTLKTMPNWKAILGIALGISGALYLILSQSTSGSVPYSISGDVLVLLNSVSYAIYLILAKPLLTKYQANTLLFFTFILGWFMVLPFGFAEFSEIPWQSIPAIDYLKITFVVFGATFLAYLFNAYGLKRVNPTGVSVYIYLQPVLATFIAISFSNDRISVLELTAALMIFTGIYFTNLSQSRH